MANILKTIIENDGELRRLEKMADKVLNYEEPNGCNIWDERTKQLTII